MKRVFYMLFTPDASSAHDRVGGVPTFLPEHVPFCPICKQEMAFLAQFNHHPVRLHLAPNIAIQFYQCGDVGNGCPPDVLVVSIDGGAIPNEKQLGVTQPWLEAHRVNWEEKMDPDVFPFPDPNDFSDEELYQSKAGGAIIFQDELDADCIGLLQLGEDPAGFNFAGRNLGVYRNSNGVLEARLF